MAKFRYQHIKSSVEGKAPTAAQLKVAEIGVNDFAGDEKLFIKNSESDVVDFPRGYSRAYIDEIERVAAESLNDLDSRKLDASAYTPTDLTNYYTKSETSGATEIQDALDDKQNVLVSGTNIKTINNESILGEGNITISGTVDQVLDETTSASTNAIATQAVYGPIADLSGQSETVAAALVDLNSEHETIAYSLVDLNNRILEISGNTSNYYTKDETSGASEIQEALDEKADISDIPSVDGYADSVKYNSETHYVEFYHGTTAGTKVFEYDASPFIIDGMVQNVEIKDVTSGGSEVTCLVISFNTDAGKQDINVPISDIFDASNYYDKTAIDALVGSGFTSSSITDVIIENEEIVSNALNDLDERKLDASAYTTTNAVTSGSTDVIESGGVYAQLDGIKLKKITQSDYDQLQTKDPNTLYIITD